MKFFTALLLGLGNSDRLFRHRTKSEYMPVMGSTLIIKVIDDSRVYLLLLRVFLQRQFELTD